MIKRCEEQRDKAREQRQEKSSKGHANATLSTVNLLLNIYTTCTIYTFNVH